MKTRPEDKPQFWLLLFGALTVSGCTSEPGILPASAGHLVVLELPPTPNPKSLGRVLHESHAAVDPAFLSASRQRITRELDADLRAGPLAKADSPRHVDIEPFDGAGMTIGSPLAAAALIELQSSQPADAYLRIRVTDYGETPRRWEAAYIGFEVVSTAAIAGALYLHKVTRPVAAAYLGEETVEEVSEGYAGFWALNRLSRPVRVEADLVDGGSGRLLWHAAHTGLSRWRWRNVRHMDDAARDALLEASMRKAVEKLAKDLEKPLSGARFVRPAG